MTHKKEEFNGNNPYIIGKGEHYTPSLNSLLRIYTQHPKFSPSVKLIYDLLFDYFNPNYGYAFPTIRQLERDSGLSESSVKRHIKTLEDLDLVVKKRSRYGNNTYLVKKPVGTLEALYDKFPDIKVKSEKRLREIERKEIEERQRRDGEKKPTEIPDKAFSIGEIKESEEIEEEWF